MEIHLQIKEQTTGFDNSITFGKLILVDLAGSEKITNPSKANIESGSINKSLLALANCINILVSQNKAFIPWRDSKLTRILQDSLGGNSRIVMVANISPSIICIEDTLYTLQYANRAKNIKISLTKNVIEENRHISKYDAIIKELKLQINEVKQELMEKEKSQVPNLLLPEEQSKDSQYDIVQNKIIAHFQEEIKLRKEIIEKEKEIENLKNEISENEYKLTKFDQDNKDSISKLLKTQKTELEKLKAVIINDYTNQSNLVKRRKDLQNLIMQMTKEHSSNIIQGANMVSLSMLLTKSLGNTYKYYISLIENFTSEQRIFVNLNEIMRKDNQIMQLMEQLDYRDQFIYTAGREIQKVDTNFNFKNNKILSADEININPYPLPVIKLQTEPNINNNKIALTQPNSNQTKKAVLTSAPKVVTNRRQYNYDLLPLINNTIGTDYLEKFQRISVPSPDQGNYDTIISNEHSIGNNTKGYKSNLTKLRNFPRKYLLNQSPSVKQHPYSPITRNYNHYRQQSMINKSQYGDQSFERVSETNTSQLENEINKKVKTILKRDIIGRYKRSPYIKKEFNL